MLYGYKFSQGICCKVTLNSSGKNVPCYHCYETPLVAPDGSTKLFCPNHVRAEAKAFKLEIKKKAIEDKLKAKLEAKEKALADKMAAAEEKALKKQKVLEEKKAKSETKKSETKKSAVKSETICVPCTAVLKTGTRKGEACGLSAGENNLCKRHSPK